MQKSIINKIHRDFRKTGHFDLPEHLLPQEKDLIMVSWVRELFHCYHETGIIIRAFDDLPPLKLSTQAGLDTTVQDIHKFIINDMNLMPLETRKAIVKHSIAHSSSHSAWQQIIPLLLSQLKGLDNEEVLEALSWKFSPIAETLWVITWLFIERQKAVPPQSVHMTSHRFPYYLWLTDEKKQSLWLPENPLCRWEWLALDLYKEWTKTA